MMPDDLVQLNKRLVHRGMEIMGLRTAIREGTELCALGTHQRTLREFVKQMNTEGLTTALNDRDTKFGDYRTAQQQPKSAQPS